MVHNIISGTVTNRQGHVPARTTALKVAKRVSIGAALIFAAFLTLGFILMATGHGADADAPRESIPACKQEDGHGQDVCVWSDDSGDVVVNLDDGRYSYSGNVMHDWTNE